MNIPWRSSPARWRQGGRSRSLSHDPVLRSRPPPLTLAATLALGSVAVEPKLNERGEREIWLEPYVVDKLRHLRGPGESYSDVILRLAKPADA